MGKGLFPPFIKANFVQISVAALGGAGDNPWDSAAPFPKRGQCTYYANYSKTVEEEGQIGLYTSEAFNKQRVL